MCLTPKRVKTPQHTQKRKEEQSLGSEESACIFSHSKLCLPTFQVQSALALCVVWLFSSLFSRLFLTAFLLRKHRNSLPFLTIGCQSSQSEGSRRYFEIFPVFAVSVPFSGGSSRRTLPAARQTSEQKCHFFRPSYSHKRTPASLRFHTTNHSLLFLLC